MFMNLTKASTYARKILYSVGLRVHVLPYSLVVIFAINDYYSRALYEHILE
jgi:hypothetical protein